MNNGCLIDKLPSRTIVKQAFQFLFFRFLLLVKRVSLHILFWLAYLVQDTLLAFLWNGSRLQGMSTGGQIISAIQLCVSLLLPKVLFTYFILYVVLQRILKQNKQRFLTFVYTVAALAVALFSVRAIETYYADPVIFHSNSRFARPFSFLFAFIDLGYITGIAVALKQVRLQLAAGEREKKLIKEKLEAELKYLRNQMNPHFLFNTLNNIYGLARKKSDDTAEVVMKLSKLLRFMIYETRAPLIKIGDEIKMLENYINLEKIRYSRKLSIVFEKKIDDESEKISPLLLMPFVENAFKHGTGEVRFDSFIRINMQLTVGILNFEIENSKEKTQPGVIAENVGLSNVKRRLELMYKEYDLQVENQEDIFRVSLKVNLKSHASI